MITLSVSNWTKIRKQIKAEYSMTPSIFMIRDAMKRELGFLPRLHTEWSEQQGIIEIVYLDFYDDAKETFFRLKYLND